TICASGRVTTPRMRWRVVCGFAVTMLTLRPTRALTSVDLPTFGRPTMATWPARKGGWLTRIYARREDGLPEAESRRAKAPRALPRPLVPPAAGCRPRLRPPARGWALRT